MNHFSTLAVTTAQASLILRWSLLLPLTSPGAADSIKYSAQLSQLQSARFLPHRDKNFLLIVAKHTLVEDQKEESSTHQ